MKKKKPGPRPKTRRKRARSRAKSKVVFEARMNETCTGFYLGHDMGPRLARRFMRAGFSLLDVRVTIERKYE